jgi:NADPH2:quinone reductase
MAEEAVVDAIHCTPIPDGLAQGETWEAAVAFPISYPTAASALMWRGRVQPGDWVLVHGAAGGVGLAGVEVAKALGCRVAARAAAGKHALLHARGAELVLDSALPFRDAVREATGGVACVLDTLGGACSTSRCAAWAMAAPSSPSATRRGASRAWRPISCC